MSKHTQPQDATEPSTDREQLAAAIDTLERYGRQGFTDSRGVSRGKAIGYALFAGLEVHTIFEAAVQALEGWNAHLLIAVMLVIQSGKWGSHRGNPPNGSVTRSGRHVRIKLPRWWADL